MRIALLVLLACMASALQAQSFPVPGKPVRIVVPFPPGGQTDIQARAIAQKMNQALNVPVIVDNKPGGSSIIGAREVQKAVPDGQVLLYTFGIHVQVPHLYKTAPWDAFRDFTPITTGARSATVLTAHASAPFNTVKELVAYAKANPGKLNYASFGAGTTAHLNGELFKKLAGIDIVHVPYKGSGDAMKDHLSGAVQLFYSDGLFGVTVLEQRGALDWAALPPGGTTFQLAGHRTRRYVLPSADVVVWERGGVVYTCVSDAPDDDFAAMVTGFTPGGPSTTQSVVDFVLGPFGW